MQKELHQYQQKNQEESYIIKGKLQEREEEVNTLKKKHESDMKSLEEKMENMFQQVLLKVNVEKLNTLQ